MVISFIGSDMYGGVFVLNKGNFFHCEEQEFTAPVPGWLVFVFLVIELKVGYWLSSDLFHFSCELQYHKNSRSRNKVFRRLHNMCKPIRASIWKSHLLLCD